MYGNGQLGLEVGTRAFTFFMHGGVSYVRGRVHGVQAAVDANRTQRSLARGTTVTVKGVQFLRVIAPSAKVGIVWRTCHEVAGAWSRAAGRGRRVRFLRRGRGAGRRGGPARRAVPRHPGRGGAGRARADPTRGARARSAGAAGRRLLRGPRARGFAHREVGSGGPGLHPGVAHERRPAGGRAGRRDRAGRDRPLRAHARTRRRRYGNADAQQSAREPHRRLALRRWWRCCSGWRPEICRKWTGRSTSPSAIRRGCSSIAEPGSDSRFALSGETLGLQATDLRLQSASG